MSDAFEKRIKRQIIGKTHRFLAVVPLGFEQTLVDEIGFISVEMVANQPHIIGDGKVEWTAKITDAWKVVAYSRIANRVLMHIADFKAENFREFEKKASEIPWELYLQSPQSLSIHVTCKHSRLYHSDAIAERLENIIKENSALKPIERENDAPYQQNIYVNFLDDRCTFWLDLAGEELYKRGHERFVNDAPLKETIAAGMLFEAIRLNSKQSTSQDPSNSALRASAQDDRSKEIQDNKGAHIALLDLMAGSGTFSLEAAYIANKLIPGVCRDFALKHQPAFKDATWNFITKNATTQQANDSKQCKANHNPIVEKIVTSDISERAIEIIMHNVECSPLANIEPKPIQPKLKDFFSYTAKEIVGACAENAAPIIVLNPPYGKRLDFDAPKLYTRIGRHLAELAHDLNTLGKPLTVAILAPKDDTRDGAKYTCTTNLLRECPSLSPEHNASAKRIVTSHGGLTLNVFIAKLTSF